MNYDSEQVDELYDVCVKRFVPHISKLISFTHLFTFFIPSFRSHLSFVFVGSFDPHLLVLLGYLLSMADCFPEELVRQIFSIDFLGKLDSQLESMSPLCLCLKSNCFYMHR